MRATIVSEVRVEDSNRLSVTPRLEPGEDYALIHRSGMDVGWDPDRKCFTSPRPAEWSHFDWFVNIGAALALEYGRRLLVDRETRWAVPSGLREMIERVQRGR